MKIDEVLQGPGTVRYGGEVSNLPSGPRRAYRIKILVSTFFSGHSCPREKGCKLPS